MRLLRRCDTGEFSLTQFDDWTVPSYAILSHTWGEDAEEVTFEDLTRDIGKNKPGYEKIRFCGEQAAQDGLEWFWIDTCCIDKSSHAELQNAINSMFRWYQDSTRCYVYLSDVLATQQKTGDEVSESTWEAPFRASRWFTRGWTLQELLAPSSVEFFSKNWKRLGDKQVLRQQIYNITGIPSLALQGVPLSQFSINERLSWKNNRHTKLEEDAAYSLLGIFGVYIAPIYGEGIDGAFKRLLDEISKLEKCIQDLRLTDPRDDKKRIEDTKGGLLKDSYRWILDNLDFQRWTDDEQSRLLCIKGDPGKGKTMLLCGIINELEKLTPGKDLVSYFFCQATDSRINSATAVLRGLLYMLVDQQPYLVSHIQKKYDQAGKALFEDVNAWVALCEILTGVLQNPSLSSTYLIIDALDECVVGLPKLLDFITQQSSAPSRVKWIVSSRNWPVIEEGLIKVGNAAKLSLELNSESVSTAVKVFIQHKVAQLAQKKKYDIKMEQTVHRHLSSNANGTFLWVALVCQSLELIPRWRVLTALDAFPPGLDSMYRQMMDQISDSGDADLCKRILALVTIVYRPISITELTPLIEILEDMANDLDSLREIISFCGSFLTLREDTIYFVHQSAKEFLLREAFGDIFPSGSEEAHYTIFSRSLQTMATTLRRDMYNLCAAGYPIERIEQPDPDPLGALRYSCIYWIDHLYDCTFNSVEHLIELRDGYAVDLFLRKKYLYWLEALSLCKSMSKGIVSMVKLQALIQEKSSTSALNQLIQDACRFIMYFKGVIENTPLQAYVSALVFSPRHSLIRALFQEEAPSWFILKAPIIDDWSACLQTLEGHSDCVDSVVFLDPNRLVSASYDGTARIWDVHSGECVQTIKGHSDSVNSMAISPDLTRMASASDDNTVKIWDICNGECVQTLEGHVDSVKSVTYLDPTQLASASNDCTIKIWDIYSGKCVQTLTDLSEQVFSIAFSSKLSWLALASYNSTLKIWDTHNGECVQMLKGHSGPILSVSFSPDSTRLVSASSDSTVKIWDTYNGKCIQTLKGHNNIVRSVVFSPDSTRLASASHDSTVKVWDTYSGECVKTLKGHSSLTFSVAFSPDSTRLASASDDNTVKIWDLRNDECVQTIESHSDSVVSVAFSPDLTRLASASTDNTVKIWDTCSSECVNTLEGHTNYIRSVAFSPDSTRLASASDDHTVKIWAAHSGECIQTLEGHCDFLFFVIFSPDSTRLASTSGDRTVKIWDVWNGKCIQTLKGHTDLVRSAVFSPDSTRLASASVDSTVKVWDAHSGECVQTLWGHDDSVLSVAFSLDSAWLASSSFDSMVKIWDAHSGECVQTFASSQPVRIISFDIAGPCLHTDIGAVTIDVSPRLSTASALIEPQYAPHRHTALSSDATWITYDSENVVWIPSDYRPRCSIVSGKTIAIGVGSGKVWICTIKHK